MADGRKRFAKWLHAADKHGRIATIIERLHQRLQKRPHHAWTHFQLGSYYSEFSQFALARHHLSKAWRRAPKQGRACIARWIAETYLGTAQFQRAQRWFEKCIAIEPYDADWLNLYGASLSARGDFPAAENLFQRATRCEEGSVDEAYLNLALIYRSQRRYAEAEAALLTALALTPDYGEAIKALRDVQCAAKIAIKP